MLVLDLSQAGRKPTTPTRPKPVLFGCAGDKLSAAERALFRDADPLGFILFKRNCQTPEQVRALIGELKDVCGREDLIVAVDQEGGRVARLQPPHWPKHPPARAFGHMYEQDPSWGLEAIKAYARVVAAELVRLGFTVNCAPVVDLLTPGGTPALGDRCFSADPAVVTALARAEAETFMSHGLLPVIKHLPGHGRMVVDPHTNLPAIEASQAELEASDFKPFAALKDMPIGMNSHAVFAALDPANSASLSAKINNDIVRGVLGFEGVLFSDDMTMKALRGTPGALAKALIDAGNDVVLHCSADASEMAAIGLALDPIGETSWARWQSAKARVAPLNPAYDPAEDAAKLDVLLGGLAALDV